MFWTAAVVAATVDWGGLTTVAGVFAVAILASNIVLLYCQYVNPNIVLMNNKYKNIVLRGMALLCGETDLGISFPVTADRMLRLLSVESVVFPPSYNEGKPVDTLPLF